MSETQNANQKESLTHQTSFFETLRTSPSAVTGTKINFDRSEIEKLDDLHKRYQIIKRVAEGGNAEIKMAIDRVLDRTVAVKSLKSKYCTDDNLLAAFVSEAKLMSQLDHPAVVPIHELRKDYENRVHISMKLIKGKSWSDIIMEKGAETEHADNLKKSQKIPLLMEKIEDFIKVCDSVNYAHRKGVIHRDLKPENIMIGPFHEVYVMDWGIAKVLGKDGLCDNSESSISGTPEYIAPEIINDQPYGPASDQYSLGVMLYEISTMTRIKTGNTINAVFTRTRAGKFKHDAMFSGENKLPEDLKAIIRKATALNPQDRYESVAKFADDLRRFIRGEETIARPDNLPRKMLRKLSEHRNVIAILFLSSLLIFSLTVIFALIHRQQTLLESKRRMMIFTRIQGAVSEDAHKISRHFIQIRDNLEFLTDQIATILETQKDYEQIRIFNYNDFKGDNPPNGTFYSDYYQQNVNFFAAAFYLKDETLLNNFSDDIKYLSRIVPKILKLMYAGIPEYKFFPEDKIIEIAGIKGLPVIWVYIAFEDGMFVNYPGNGDISVDYDFKSRQWYKRALESEELVWTGPYIDALGSGLVVTASRKIKTSEGKIHGVVAFDISFNYIHDIMKSENSRKHLVMSNYLIDSSGNIILSSALNKEMIKEAEKDFSSLRFGKFPYSEIVDNINRIHSGQFEVEKDGISRLISYSFVPDINLFYVEELDLDRVLSERN